MGKRCFHVDMPITPAWLITICMLGLLIGLLSGFLGLGGGSVLAPALLFMPPLLGLGTLTMHQVAGLTITQGLAAAAAGGWQHRRYGFFRTDLVLTMGPATAAAALLGAVASRWVPATELTVIFTGMVSVAVALMLVPIRKSPGPRRAVSLWSAKAGGIAVGVGLLGGLVGQGGSFLLIPLMLHGLRLPTRLTIGSSLGIVFLSSLAAFVGKWATGQVPLALAAVLVLGAVPGARLGAAFSRRTPPPVLRYCFAGLYAIVVAALWHGLLFAG